MRGAAAEVVGDPVGYVAKHGELVDPLAENGNVDCIGYVGEDHCGEFGSGMQFQLIKTVDYVCGRRNKGSG